MTFLPDNALSVAEVSEQASVLQAADLVVSYLEQIGVQYIFGVPGGAIEPLYNAMARSSRRGGLRPIVARHEAGAAFMADGYARETGRLGVCCATTGPGATNLLTGVACAYADNIPMLVITAQTPLYTFGKGAFQESSSAGINTVGMFEHCTRYNSLVSHMEQLEGQLVSAIMTACRAPKGPVHLSIPLDILRSQPAISKPSFSLDMLLSHEAMSNMEAIDELCDHIARAKKVVMLVGSGCNEAIATILSFACLINAAIVTTPTGKGLVSSYHPLFKGVFGFAGHGSAQQTLTSPEVDLVLAIGTGLSEWDSMGWDKQALLNNHLVHIDSMGEHLNRAPMARMHIHGRISTLLDLLLKEYTLRKYASTTHAESETYPDKQYRLVSEAQQVERRSSSSLKTIVPGKLPRYFKLDNEDKYLDDTRPIKPQRLMRELGERFPINTRFLVDTGNSFAWAIHYLHLHPYDRRTTGTRAINSGVIRTSMGFSAMGWAIGSAVGTALASPHATVVCITGDGSFLMSGQEISVAVAERLSIIFVVLNDRALGMVKHGQRLAGAEQIGFELPPVDFCMLARAQGAQAFTIHSPQDIAALDMAAICAHAGPTLLDVYIDPEEVPPMGARIRVLNNL